MSTSSGFSDRSYCRIAKRVYPVIYLLTVCPVLLFFISYVIMDLKKDGGRTTCRENLRNYGDSLRGYHDFYNSLPMQVNLGEGVRHPYSWRVAILPGGNYALPDAAGVLPGGYRTDQPWDGPDNLKLADKVGGYYHCPADPSSIHDTSYIAVVGQNTSFPPRVAVKFDGFDGKLSNSILIVETHNSGIHWMEPRDWSIEEAIKGVNSHGKRFLDGRHVSLFSSRNPQALFADGSIREINPNIDPKILRSLLEINNPDKPKEPFISP